jgi:hypothetical protein
VAFARAIGAEALEAYRAQGDGHVATLRHHDLADGMAVLDFYCGCGRTAEAMVRYGWIGDHAGVELIERFLAEVCAPYPAAMHPGIARPAHRRARKVSTCCSTGRCSPIFRWKIAVSISGHVSRFEAGRKDGLLLYRVEWSGSSPLNFNRID